MLNPGWSRKNFSFIILLAVIAILWITRILTPVDTTLTWDVFGYYLWLPAKFVHHDIWLDNIAWVKDVMKEHNVSGTLYQAYIGPNGTWMYWFCFGMGYLYAPFFFLAHIYAKLGGFKADGFSMPYQYAIAYGSMVYASIGLFFLWKILRRYFKELTIGAVILIIVLGTNYFHFTAIGGAATANYLFTLLAALIWFTIKWHERPRLIYALVISGILAITVLVKPSEFISILIPLLWNCWNKEERKDKLEKIKAKWWHILVMLMFGLLVLFPQMFYWKNEAGKWIYDSYNNPGVGLDFLSPHIGKVLLSFRKGWFIYTPIIMFAFAGVYNLWKNKKELLLPLGVYFLVTFYIVSSWTEWWYGGGYGQRALIASYVVLSIPVGFLLEDLFKKKYLRIVMGVIFFLLIVLNLFQTWQYNHYILDPDRMTRKYYMRIFGRTSIQPEDRYLLMTERSYTYDDYFPGTKFYDCRNIGLYDFEEDQYPGFERYYSNDTARSGISAMMIDSTIEYSPVIKTTYSGITNRDHAWIKASVWMYFKDSLSREAPFLVITTMHKGGNYKYKTKNIKNEELKCGEWQKVEISFQTPEVRSIEDEIAIYVWNRDKQKCLIDDLKADAYTLKY
jgi:hypothetical protein